MPRVYWIAIGLLAAGLAVLIVNDEVGRTFGLPNQDFGSALYLSILGLVLAAGLLGSGMGVRAAMRNLAAWIVIVLVLIGGYQYRYELQDVAARLTAGLVPGSPYSAFDAQGRPIMVLDILPDGHFEARAWVDRAAIRMVVDTGATMTVLTARDAANAGIDMSALTYNVPIMTANGAAMAARARVDELRVGDISRRRLPVLVIEEGRLSRSLLGMNFIGSLSGFDLRGDRLILRD